MKCACIALLVFFFIVFGAGTPYIVYRNTGASETVPDTNTTEPVGSGTTTNGTATTTIGSGTTTIGSTTTNGTATTNGTTTNGTSLSGGSTRRALAACPQTDLSSKTLLLATEGDDGTFICTYASGACTYDSETGVLLDDQNGGSCPKEVNVKDRARKSRRGMRYEAIAKRVLA